MPKGNRYDCVRIVVFSYHTTLQTKKEVFFL